MTSAETRESAWQKTDWIRSLEMDLQDTLFEDLPPLSNPSARLLKTQHQDLHRPRQRNYTYLRDPFRSP